jgi:hypothetical protein
VILLLHGYDKAARSSARHQQREINEAKRRLRAWKRQLPPRQSRGGQRSR